MVGHGEDMGSARPQRKRRRTSPQANSRPGTRFCSACGGRRDPDPRRRSRAGATPRTASRRSGTATRSPGPSRAPGIEWTTPQARRWRGSPGGRARNAAATARQAGHDQRLDQGRKHHEGNSAASPDRKVQPSGASDGRTGWRQQTGCRRCQGPARGIASHARRGSRSGGGRNFRKLSSNRPDRRPGGRHALRPRRRRRPPCPSWHRPDRVLGPSTTSLSTWTSSTPSIDGRSNMVSSRMPSRIERRPRAPVLRSIAFLATDVQRLVGEAQLDVLHVEQLLILLHQRVLRLDQDLDQGFLVEVLERGDHRQAADELGDQAELEQILGLGLLQHLAGAAVSPARRHGRRSRSTCPAGGRR